MRSFTKKLIFTVTCIFFLVSARAQSQLEDVINAVRSNKISDITKYFDNVVPITMNNVQSSYSRSQGEIVLKDFFYKNPPSDITVLNSGSPNSSSKFVIGDLNTSNGKFSIYFLFKLKDNSVFLLQEIRISKE